MGSEAAGTVFSPSFNRSIKIIARDDRLTAEAGTLALREADHRLGALEWLAERICDPRDPKSRRYEIKELLRERVYGISSGYARQDDADRLAHDPAMRAAVWDQPGQRVAGERLGSQPTQSRLLKLLTGNREALSQTLAKVIVAHRRARGERHRVQRGTVDIDGFDIEAHGGQEGAAYNGYYGRKVYLPLMASFATGGDYDHPRLGDGFLHAQLRNGDAGQAEGAVPFIREAVARAREMAEFADVRFDAAFTIGPVMDPLEDAGIRFVGRLRKNARLDKLAEPHLVRPSGRPPKEGYESVVELGQYKADDWAHSFRLVLVVVDGPDPKTGLLPLFPRYFFLITNWPRETISAEDLLAHYRKRGTFEDRFSELVGPLDIRLSCPKFAENEATLLLHLLAFNLLNVLRAEMEEETGSGWDLKRVQQTVLRGGARVVPGGRRLRFYLATASAMVWAVLFPALERWKTPAPAAPHPRPYVAAPAHSHMSLVYRL
jgi:hypothetical protein